MALTVKKVERLTRVGRHGDGHNLYLQIEGPRSKRWVFRYVRNGVERGMSLGATHILSLEEARERARLARVQLLDGIDPIDARRVERAARATATAHRVTFAQAGDEFFAAKASLWQNDKHRDQYISSLRTYAYPVIGSLPVAEVDTAAVLRVLEPKWAEVNETMSRLRGRIEQVLDFAAVRGYRPPNDNPARWRWLSHLLPSPTAIQKEKHHAALPFAELPAFWTALEARPGIPARALAFLILTAARTGEATGALWAEIDWGNRLWLIPGERMKSGKPHRVPLSAPAMALLAALPRESDFIFPGAREGRPITNLAVTLQRMGYGHVTVHGFRSSFRDWIGEATSHENIVAEMALAHTIGDKTESAYRRGDLIDRRRAMMADWGRYVTTLPATATVTAIGEARLAARE